MKKVLIVRLSSMGDIIFHIPLANIFKENGYEVGWVVSEKGYEILKNNPCLDKVYFVPAKKWKKRGLNILNLIEYLKILFEIRKEKYDVVIDCQKMFKSLIWTIFSGGKRRLITTPCRDLSNLGANEIIKNVIMDFNKHVLYYDLGYAKYLGLNADNIKFTLPEASAEVKANVDELLKDLDKTKPMVIIAPATTREMKHWDVGNWRVVVENLRNDCSLVFTGAEENKELLNEVGADKGLNLCGKTNLESLIEVFKRADLVISPDSGSAHLAWASGKPAVIAIFTCTNPKFYGPFGNEKYVAINGGLECQPCPSTQVCAMSGDKYKQCTRNPSPEKILNIVKKLLKFDTVNS